MSWVPNTGVALRARDLPTPPTADPLVELAFQRVAGWFPPRWPDPAYPQQLHLDIRVHDAELAEHELIALGATRVPGERETGFRVFTDPAGHPFCIVFGHKTRLGSRSWTFDRLNTPDLRIYFSS